MKCNFSENIKLFLICQTILSSIEVQFIFCNLFLVFCKFSQSKIICIFNHGWKFSAFWQIVTFFFNFTKFLIFSFVSSSLLTHKVWKSLNLFNIVNIFFPACYLFSFVTINNHLNHSINFSFSLTQCCTQTLISLKPFLLYLLFLFNNK